MTPVRGVLGTLLVATATLFAAVPASADLTSLKAACAQRDAADGSTGNGVTLPFVFCDDGVPPVGGRTANRGLVSALGVPQSYDGFAGLPAKVPPQPNTGADGNGDIALDVDVSMPDPGRFPPPAEGYPLVTMMHGCCAGDKTGWEAATIDSGGAERWHQSNAWYASRGYVVLTYTARGFVNGQGRGSTGETQLDSRRYEINDFQHLAGQLADDPFFHVDPSRVVVTGGSYGAGFAWMALTDPTWRSPGGLDMRLVAAAPKYGWTDLVYALVPNGHHDRDVLPPFDGSGSFEPFGFPKRSINAALFASGETGVPPGSSHTTFPNAIRETLVCLNSTDPPETNPLCAGTLRTTLPEFRHDRSAYNQREFFERLASDPAARVPLFSAGTFTDQLFTNVEHRRMVERLKSIVPDYPVQEFYGDYNHFVQNKAKEWGDLCGADHHVCRLEDYPGGDVDAVPPSRVRAGVSTRLTRFVDHYARPPGNPSEPRPRFDVTASLHICPANAGGPFPADEPGMRYTADTFGALAPETLRIELTGNRTTTSSVFVNQHALNADPVANTAANGSRCAVETSAPGPGVAMYESQPLERAYTLIGRTRVTVPHTGFGSGGIQLNARLYDVFPDGRAVLMDRGVRVAGGPSETTVFDLHGNAWRFAQGHRVRIELAQDDDPFIKASTRPSSLTLTGVTLELPVREAGPAVAIDAPRLATDTSRTRRFDVGVAPSTGERTGIDRLEVEARSSRTGAYRQIRADLDGDTLRVLGVQGRSYDLRARAHDVNGVTGPWAEATTVVPLDDSARAARYAGRWSRVRSADAYGGQLRQSARRGDRIRLRVRGRRVEVIGRTGPRGGRALVTLDGRRRVVSFFGREEAERRVVASLVVRGRGSHVLELRNLGRRARGGRGIRVELDAFAVFR